VTPEFSRPERLDTIGTAPREVRVEANEQERAALAKRFALLGVDRLAARLAVVREGDAFLARGTVEAEVVQACSASGEPVPARIAEAVALRFVEGDAREDEVELDDSALDTIEIQGGAIDLGEAAAETMALALDPFPRAAGSEAVLRSAGVVAEDEMTPFNAFAALKDKLGL
jgi:uncharacterized metal-binding protein YceD (DUF177 family)